MRAAVGLLIPVVLSACASVAAPPTVPPTPLVTPSPVVIYVTPAPTSAPPTPAPTVAPTPGPTSPPQADGSRANPYPMGQSQRVGDWDITILSINPDAWSVVRAENQFNDPPSPGFQYVMFRVSATYRGTDTGSAWLDLNWAIVGTSGNTFDEGTEYACGVIPDEMYDVGDLYPDATAEANVCVAVQSAQLNGAAIRLQAGFFGDEVFFRTDGNGPGTTPGPIGGLTPGFLALTVEQIDWLGTISDDLDAITSAGDPWRPRLLRPAVTDALQNSQDIQTWLTGNTPDDACYSGLYIAWSLFINEWVDGLDKVDYGLLPPITYDDVNDGLEQLVGALDLFDNIEPAMNATTCI